MLPSSASPATMLAGVQMPDAAGQMAMCPPCPPVSDAAAQGAGRVGRPAPSKAQCMKHGKRRGLEFLVEDGSGGYVCSPESLCQVGARDGQAADLARAMCSLHGKPRSLDCLVDDGAGGHRCSEENACRLTGEPKGSRGGPNLPRKRITEAPITGSVLEWKGKFGWVRPEVPLEHAQASRRGGKIYVASQDLVECTEMVAGGTVHFHVYVDSSGLGAEDCHFVPESVQQ